MESFPTTGFGVDHPGKSAPQLAGVGGALGACTAELRGAQKGAEAQPQLCLIPKSSPFTPIRSW